MVLEALAVLVDEVASEAVLVVAVPVDLEVPEGFNTFRAFFVDKLCHLYHEKHANVTKCKVVVTFYNLYLIIYPYLCTHKKIKISKLIFNFKNKKNETAKKSC